MRRHLLFGSVLLATTALSASAWAQSTPASSGEPEATTVEEIVVTAQRREQRLQDVPVAVTAISSETLKMMNITSSEGLQNATPGLNLAISGGYPQPFIRGVGNDRSSNSEASVATYLDGIYLAFSAASTQDLFDVERVEVLRGPQGTLFGRNATGGAINIVTRRPSQTYGAEAEVTAGNHDLVRGQLYLTGPFTDTLAGSLAVSGRRQDSFTHNISTKKVAGFKEEETGTFARAKLLWQPSEIFEAEAGVSYVDTFSFDSTAYRLISPNGIGLGLGGVTGTRPFEAAYGQQVDNEVTQYGANLKMSLETNIANLVSISGYVLTNQYPKIELGGTDVTVFRVFNDPTRSEQFSQEFQILSKPESPIDWILGTYFFTEQQSNEPYNLTVRRNAGPAGIQNVTNTATDITAHTNAFSLFGQATAPLTSTLSLTGGLRYSRETRSVDQFSVTNVLPNITNSTATTVYPGRSVDFNKLTYKLGLDYKPRKNQLFYASVSRGFKAGIFNLSNPVGDLGPVQPEILDAYEIGSKTDFFDSRVRLNVSAFYYDFSNLQVTILSPTAVLRNAASAEMKGAEFELQTRPMDRLRVTASLSLLDANYKDFPNFGLNVPSTTPFGGNVSVPIDLSGTEMMRSPGFTGSVSAIYDIPLGNSGNLRLGASYYHSAEFKYDPAGVNRQPAYDNLDATVTYSPASDAWNVSVWAKNLTEDRLYAVALTSANGNLVIDAPPMTFGITLAARFGGQR